VDQERDVPEVRPPTLEDIRRICRALADAEARYVLIGGFAVILLGGERTTKDIDLLVDPAPDNVARLKKALSILEDDAAREIELGDLQKYTVVRVADEVMVDLLASACGVTWAQASRTAEHRDLDGIPVVLADPATLILTKQTLRPSDAADRAWLEALEAGDDSA
jgi:Nucleotidyl transferase AbiEii toxin, Type IV TA system